MANTGYVIYQNLEEYDVETGQATGNTKPNDPSDPDYVEPVEDLQACPVSTYYLFLACDGTQNVKTALTVAPLSNQRYIDFGVEPNRYYRYSGQTEEEGTATPVVGLQPVSPEATGCPS